MRAPVREVYMAGSASSLGYARHMLGPCAARWRAARTLEALEYMARGCSDLQAYARKLAGLA